MGDRGFRRYGFEESAAENGCVSEVSASPTNRYSLNIACVSSEALYDYLWDATQLFDTMHIRDLKQSGSYP